MGKLKDTWEGIKKYHKQYSEAVGDYDWGDTSNIMGEKPARKKRKPIKKKPKVIYRTKIVYVKPKRKRRYYYD